MFDVAPTEFLLVAVVALLVIGPKDLPKAMRVAGHWVGRMRAVARHFRAGFDNMVREAELEEMEKRWAAENARIMAEHGAQNESAQIDTVPGSASADVPPQSSVLRGNPGDPAPAGALDGAARPRAAHGERDPFAVEPEAHDTSTAPVFVEKPEIRPAPGGPPHPPHAGVTS